jgi:hypothetical protein
MEDIEQRIREHAFLLWEAAGCPADRTDEFWHRAKEIELGLTQPAEGAIDQTGDEPSPATDPASFAGF